MPALAEYQRKRDFSHTPEPRGAKRARGNELHFVVQKHAARRLHYDFRLELDGTLKSWAVPNEPSTDPSVKRLAVHVEDHPLDYAKFEGVIPAGHYGAGKVEIWDEGVWRPQGDANAGYRKGHLAFELEGKRLQGGWDLVRMRAKPGEKGKGNWLLIKKDEKAAPVQKKSKPKQVAMPRIMSPQLATLVETAPAGGEWIYEIKYDGYRMLCRIDDGKVRFFSRNGKDWTARFPRHAQALAKLPLRQAWLDGEMAVFLPDGNTSFQALQNALDEGKEANVLYAAFDLLYLDGEDWSARPLIQRKDRLRELLAKRPPLAFYSEHQESDGEEARAHACEHGLEGVIGKRRDAAYVQERSRSWIKLKCRRGQELVIGGYTEPGGSRSGFGALLMGVREKGGLRYAGKVGTGFDDRTLAFLHKRLTRLEQKQSPFGSGAPKGAHWVRPELVADIKFHGWTDDGLLRQGAFMGLREDKPAREVEEEKPRDENTVAGVEISHPERVLYPAIHATKLDLARYYESVGEWILPHLRDRPLSLVRCPRGPEQKCFFQRNAHETMPKRGEFIVADSAEALAQLVQMGVIELHTWGSREAKPLAPDRMIFDLDPDPGLPWSSVADGAKLVRTLLSELRLESYLKTTGGKGLHVVVPLRAGHSWNEVKDFSRQVAEHLAATLPGQFTAKMSKALRRGKIFIDYLRNQEGATAVAAYSVRAHEGAPVSAPLAWDELAGRKPVRFDLRTILARLKHQKSDPWEGYAERQRLTQTMRKML